MTTQFYQKYANGEGGSLRPIFQPLILTTAQRDALTLGATQYLIIINSTTKKINFWNGTAWEVVTSA